VREELKAADAVLPSLDAGNEALYRRINRPPHELTFESLVKGLIAFRKEYSGRLWVEVMLVGGMNDNEMALNEIATLLKQIEPDEVHIVQPTRPPVEKWVEPPNESGLLLAQKILGDVAAVILPATGSFDLGSEANLVDAIVGIITRHPMKESELMDALMKWSPTEVRKTLKDLAASGKAQTITRYGTQFWSASEASYPNHEQIEPHLDLQKDKKS
jgi:wyosine [tRNA(Phe)-imidazoG37] synthetase (radical SAM superfamily)